MSKLDLSDLKAHQLTQKNDEVVPQKNVSSNMPVIHQEISPAPIMIHGQTVAEKSGSSMKNMAMAAISIPAALASEGFGVINNVIHAYKEIQLSHDQVKIVQAQADAYVAARQEETKQVEITKREETIQYYMQCQRDIQLEEIEFRKFEAQLNAKREERKMIYDAYNRKILQFEKFLQQMMENSQTIWSEYQESGFKDENIGKAWQELQQYLLQALIKLESVQYPSME